ncbi:MAG: hypothetical protein GC166_14270 [Alphaproteobacteria bacterium]|nr:hypothetical protein [Alphaproteobacteria bacterium]
MASDDGETIRKRSGWIVPIAVFVITAALSALFLLFYLAPEPASLVEERATPTDRSDPVSLQVAGMKMIVPANYIRFASVRNGGKFKDVSLYATFPDFRGYTGWEAQTFSGNAADSPVIFYLIREENVNLSEEERFKRIYLSYVTDPSGTAGPFGLRQYTFRDDSGYRGEDLFVGTSSGQPVVMRCVRFSENVPSPSCLRDVRLGKRVALSYRFKRALLGRWQEIADGSTKLIQGFKSRAKED